MKQTKLRAKRILKFWTMSKMISHLVAPTMDVLDDHRHVLVHAICSLASREKPSVPDAPSVERKAGSAGRDDLRTATVHKPEKVNRQRTKAMKKQVKRPASAQTTRNHRVQCKTIKKRPAAKTLYRR